MKSIPQILMVGFGLLLIATLSNVFSMPVQAELPPRPTPTPVPVPTSAAPRGATIVLQTQVGAWSVVQWQDVNGDWHDVDGWRGAVTDGTVVWWVAQKDFGTGPFRWVAYQSDGGAVMAASAPFTLPDAVNQRLLVTLP